MLNIGLPELVIIFFIAYIVVGPKDFPKVVRYCAKKIIKIRSFINELKAESGWDDMIKEIDDVKSDTTKTIEDIKSETVLAVEDVKEETKKVLEDSKNELNETSELINKE